MATVYKNSLVYCVKRWHLLENAAVDLVELLKRCEGFSGNE